MVLLNSLVTLVGKPLAASLIEALTNRKNGQAKLDSAVEAMAKGASAVEALRKAFGREFLPTLNEVLVSNDKAPFQYEAGTQAYISLDGGQPLSIGVLRDELNVNLDRVAALDGSSKVIRNQFRGLIAMWKVRCLQVAQQLDGLDAEPTLAVIDSLLAEEQRNYRQVFEILAKTTLGSTGALMVIASAVIATGTGVGLLTAVTATLFGIPWLTVGSLAIPGLLMVFLARRGVSPKNELSLAVAAAYQLLALMEKTPPRKQEGNR